MGAEDLEFLGFSGRVEFAGTASAKQLRQVLRDPKGIRKWLAVRRKTASAEEEALIWRALFVLYSIPEEWPNDIKLWWLAGRLAAELFPRCQALAKPRGGGPSEKRQEKLRKRKARLLKKLEAFQHARPHLKSWIRAAELFMEEPKNKKACAAAGFTKPKSFAQAMKEISSGTAN